MDQDSRFGGQQCDVREAGLARALKWMVAGSGPVFTDVISLGAVCNSDSRQ